MEYVNLFVSNTVVLVARFVTFICGAILAVLIFLGFYDEKFLLSGHIVDDQMNMLFIVGALGTVLATARQLIPSESFVFEPEK